MTTQTVDTPQTKPAKSRRIRSAAEKAQERVDAAKARYARAQSALKAADKRLDEARGAIADAEAENERAKRALEFEQNHPDLAKSAS